MEAASRESYAAAEFVQAHRRYRHLIEHRRCCVQDALASFGPLLLRPSALVALHGVILEDHRSLDKRPSVSNIRDRWSDKQEDDGQGVFAFTKRASGVPA